MNILMLNTLYPPMSVGGAEKSVQILARQLADTGDIVTVVSLHGGDRTVAERDGLVNVYRLPMRNLYWPYGDAERPGRLRRLGWHTIEGVSSASVGPVTSIALSIRPDVVHTNNLTGFGGGLLPALSALGLPIVHTLRDFGLLCSRATLFRGGRDCTVRCAGCRVLTLRKQADTRYVDVVCGNSAYMIDRHRSEGLFTETPARVIFNAIQAPSGRAELEEPAQSGARMAIGFAGRIEPEKGIGQLLQACEGLPQDTWTLFVAGRGDPSYVNQLRASYKNLPVIWLGFVPIEKLMSQIDALVVPSIWPEPMPRTLLDAMAWGKTVIASDAGGTPEVAKFYSGSRIYSRYDVEALRSILARLIAEGRQYHVIPDGLLDKFSAKTTGENYRMAYQQAIDLCQGKGAQINSD